MKSHVCVPMIEPLLTNSELIDRLSARFAYFADKIPLYIPWQLGAKEVWQQILALILNQHREHRVLILEHTYLVKKFCLVRTISV